LVLYTLTLTYKHNGVTAELVLHRVHLKVSAPPNLSLIMYPQDPHCLLV
jgi:hypothetical protein